MHRDMIDAGAAGERGFARFGGEALAARCQQWLDGARDRLAAVRAQDRDDPDATRTTGTTETREQA